MTLKNGLRLLLVLSCLSSPGCAGLDRRHQEKPKPPEAALTPQEKEDKYMKDLARDIHLYSDGG
jgi:hypothetical protein